MTRDSKTSSWRPSWPIAIQIYDYAAALNSKYANIPSKPKWRRNMMDRVDKAVALAQFSQASDGDFATAIAAICEILDGN